MAVPRSRGGLDVIVQCAWFDEDIAPAADHLRMQFVLEKSRLPNA